MADGLDYLNDFAAKIDPHLDCWRSLNVAFIATRVGREWVQVAANATLSTQALESESISKPVVALEDFRAYAGRLETKKIHDLIANLKASTIHSQFGDDADAVRLVPSGSQPYHWWQPSARRRPTSDPSPKCWPSAWSIHGSGPSDLPTAWPDIDTRLRRHRPPYNGLGALCAALGLQYAPSTNSPHFNLYAELPARFLQGIVDRKAKSLKLTMEYVITPELLIEWRPTGETRHEPVPVGNPQIPAQHDLMIPIPSGATGIKANLLTMECDADEISLRVDWENILLRICEFFDPSQTRLEDYLFNENNLKNVNPFELGVARLLGLAGYTVLWFGKAVKESLADLVAYGRTPLGVERIICGECTLKNPAEKFSDLAKRTDDLTNYLALQAGSILPVVFVRSETTDQERQAGKELGLVLCGGSDIQKLQDTIKSDATPDDVFKFLRSLSNLILFSENLGNLTGLAGC